MLVALMGMLGCMLEHRRHLRSHEAIQVITIGTLLLSCHTTVGGLSFCSLAAPPCRPEHALDQPLVDLSHDHTNEKWI